MTTEDGVDVVVIGSDANGLVAATSLAKTGLRVTVLEAEETIGGAARLVEFAPGFRAAALATDPGWMPRPIAQALELDVPERTTLDAPLTVIDEPGSALTLSRDCARAAEAIKTRSASDAAKWPAFTARLGALAGFLETLYQTRAPDVEASSFGEMIMMLKLGRKLRGLGREQMFDLLRMLPISVGELVDDWFEHEPLKAAVATGGIQNYRHGPRAGGTGFVLLHHLVGAPQGSVRGRLPLRGNPAAFTDGVEHAARKLNVTIRTGVAIERIRIENDAATGVVLAGGDVIPARAVLSTADPSRTLLDWVDPVWLDPEFIHAVRNIRYRGCTAFVLYALDALPVIPGVAPEALAGLVSLTPSVTALERAADATKYGVVSERPHIELTVPSLVWPELAPQGKHVLVARMQYAPYALREGTWDAARRDALATTVTSAITAVSSSFSSHVLHRVAWTPLDLEQRFGLREGAVSQGELGLDQILFMRPVAGYGRHATPIGNLYLGGVSTHPGPGILGGGGWFAARRLVDDRRRGS